MIAAGAGDGLGHWTPPCAFARASVREVAAPYTTLRAETRRASPWVPRAAHASAMMPRVTAFAHDRRLQLPTLRAQWIDRARRGRRRTDRPHRLQLPHHPRGARGRHAGRRSVLRRRAELAHRPLEALGGRATPADHGRSRRRADARARAAQLPRRGGAVAPSRARARR